MVSIRNDHCGEIITSHTGPDHVFVTVDHIRATIAEVCQKFCSGFGGAFHIFQLSQLVSAGNNDTFCSNMRDKFRHSGDFGSHCQQLDITIGTIHDIIKERSIGSQDEFRNVSSDSTGLRRNERSFQMCTGDLFQQTVSFCGMIHDSEIPEVNLTGTGHDRRQKQICSGCKNVISGFQKLIFGQIGSRKIHSHVSVDLKVSITNIVSHDASLYFFVQRSRVNLLSSAAAGTSQKVRQSLCRRITEAGCSGQSSPSNVILTA